MQETYSGKGSRSKFRSRHPNAVVAAKARLTCGNAEVAVEREFSQLLLLPYFLTPITYLMTSNYSGNGG